MFSFLFRSWTHVEDRWANVVRRYSVPPLFDLTPLSVAVMTATFSSLFALIHQQTMTRSAEYSGFEWSLRDDDDGVLAESFSTESAGLGVLGVQPLPFQVSSLVILRTVAGSPTRTRGLVYLPFQSTDWLAPDGRLTDAGLGSVDAVAAALAQVRVDALGREYKPLVWRRSTLEGFQVGAGQGRRGFANQRRRGTYWPSEAGPPWI